MSLFTIDQAKLDELKAEQVTQSRKIAYQFEADPLFFKWQAGEATEAEWKAKRDEIKARFPKE
jgi:hypothetical protein